MSDSKNNKDTQLWEFLILEDWKMFVFASILIAILVGVVVILPFHWIESFFVASWAHHWYGRAAGYVLLFAVTGILSSRANIKKNGLFVTAWLSGIMLSFLPSLLESDFPFRYILIICFSVLMATTIIVWLMNKNQLSGILSIGALCLLILCVLSCIRDINYIRARSQNMIQVDRTNEISVDSVRAIAPKLHTEFIHTRYSNYYLKGLGGTAYIADGKVLVRFTNTSYGLEMFGIYCGMPFWSVERTLADHGFIRKDRDSYYFSRGEGGVTFELDNLLLVKSYEYRHGNYHLF